MVYNVTRMRLCRKGDEMLRFLLYILLLTSTLYASNIAIVKKTDGNVYVIRETAMIDVGVGDYLHVRDTLITKANSGIGVLFHDGTILTLGENSILSIDEFLFNPSEHDFQFDIDFKKGLVSFESGKIGELAPESVNFKVPQGTIGIRGTKFYVEVK